MRTVKKFAWRPVVVWTWRSAPTKAIIWMQGYYRQGDDIYSSLSTTRRCFGEKYCTKLGIFSYELR